MKTSMNNLKWKLAVTAEDGTRKVCYFATKKAAEQMADFILFNFPCQEIEIAKE